MSIKAAICGQEREKNKKVHNSLVSYFSGASLP